MDVICADNRLHEMECGRAKIVSCKSESSRIQRKSCDVCSLRVPILRSHEGTAGGRDNVEIVNYVLRKITTRDSLRPSQKVFELSIGT
jgi:hypothetical protein